MQDELEPDFKIPSAIPWKKIGVGVVVAVAVVGAFWVAGRVEDWRRAQKHEEAAALNDAADELEEALRPRLVAARDAVADFRPAAEAASCGAEVAQDEPLVVAQLVWLDWLLDSPDGRNPPYDTPFDLNSDVINWLADVVSSAEPSVLERRNALYERLLGSRYVGVFVGTDVEAARLAGEGTFEGGRARGQLAIVDVEESAVACHVGVTSQALFAVHLEQRDPGAAAAAERDGLRSATRSAFWRAAREGLASVSSALHLDEPAAR